MFREIRQHATGCWIQVYPNSFTCLCCPPPDAEAFRSNLKFSNCRQYEFSVLLSESAIVIQALAWISRFTGIDIDDLKERVVPCHIESGAEHKRIGLVSQDLDHQAEEGPPELVVKRMLDRCGQGGCTHFRLGIFQAELLHPVHGRCRW